MVAFFIEVGLLLIVVPWSSFWDRNYFGVVWPWLRPWFVNDYMRGAVSGLGFVNLFAGVADLLPIVLPRVEPELLDQTRTEGRS